VIAKLFRPVIAVRQDVPSVVETIPAGATVDYDPIEGIAEVVWEGKTYSVMLTDLLEAVHPGLW
jgi:hypothetical protein